MDVAAEELDQVAEGVAWLVLAGSPAISFDDAVTETRRLLLREIQGRGTATYDRGLRNTARLAQPEPDQHPDLDEFLAELRTVLVPTQLEVLDRYLTGDSLSPLDYRHLSRLRKRARRLLDSKWDEVAR